MTEPRDEAGDKTALRDVTDPWDLTAAGHRNPLRTTVRLHAGGWVARWREEMGDE